MLKVFFYKKHGSNNYIFFFLQYLGTQVY